MQRSASSTLRPSRVTKLLHLLLRPNPDGPWGKLISALCIDDLIILSLPSSGHRRGFSLTPLYLKVQQQPVNLRLPSSVTCGDPEIPELLNILNEHILRQKRCGTAWICFHQEAK